MVSRGQTVFHSFIFLIGLSLFFIPWEKWYIDGINLSHTLSLPDYSALLGRDALGRDVFIRCVNTVSQVILPVWASGGLGFVAGIIFGFLRLCTDTNWVVDKIFIIADSMLSLIASFPMILFCFTLALLFEQTSLMGVLYSVGLIGICKGYFETLQLYYRDNHLEYWQAHMIAGGSKVERVLIYGFKQVWLKHLAGQLVNFLQLALIAEVTLAYLGFGVPEPIPSFGNMLASHYDLILKGHWHPVLSITAFFILTMLFPQSLLFWVNCSFSKRV